MRKIILASVAVPAVLVCAGAVAAQASSNRASTPSGYRTFTVVERAVTDTTADTGRQGDSRGDVLAFANPIYGHRNRGQVGSDNGSCIRTRPGHAYDCQWSVRLPKGALMVQGPFLDAGDSTLTITGGTGAFIGASGEMRLHARNAAGSAYDFTYTVKK